MLRNQRLAWFFQMCQKETRYFLWTGIQASVTADDFGIDDAARVKMAGAFLQQKGSNLHPVLRFAKTCTSCSLGSIWCGIRQFDSGMLMLAGTNAAPVPNEQSETNRMMAKEREENMNNSMAKRHGENEGLDLLGDSGICLQPEPSHDTCDSHNIQKQNGGVPGEHRSDACNQLRTHCSGEIGDQFGIQFSLCQPFVPEIS